MEELNSFLDELQTLGALIANATNAYKETWDERAGDEMARLRCRARSVKASIRALLGGETA